MRINKPVVAAAVVLTAFLVLPGLSFAQSVDQIQAQIQSLLAQVAQLRAQLAQQQGTTQQWCHTFDTNLGVGSSGSEVTALQTALTKENLEANPATAGVYDEMTASLVTAFQEKYRNDVLAPAGLAAGTGYLGARTRAKLNALYGCGTGGGGVVCPMYVKVCPDGSYVGPDPNNNCQVRACPPATTTQSIVILSPNGGERWATGGTYTISWQANGFDSSDTTNIVLLNASTNAAYTIENSVSVSAGSYSWTIPSSIPAGSYKVMLGYRSSPNDTSNEPFNITASQSDVPTISGVSGPTTLHAGEQGTWTVKASDPNNGTLSYGVTWGDEITRIYAYGAAQTNQAAQSATFTHTYNTTGNFQPTFTVSNTSGKTAQTSLSVNISGSISTNVPPKIIGGTAPTNIQPNQQATFSWSATDANNDDLSWGVDWGEGVGQATTCQVSPPAGTGKNWNYSTTHTWNSAGTYTVKVTVSDCRGGSDSNSLSVTVSNTSQPSITITPSVLHAGDTATIGWNTSYTGSTSFYEEGTSGQVPVLIKTMTGTAGDFRWTVPAGESGDRRIHGGNNYDGDFYSAPFSIVSAAQPPSGAPAFYQGPIGNKITSAACGTAFTFQVDGYSGSQVWLTQTKNGTTSYDSILNVPDTYTPVCNRDEGTYTETVYTVTNGQKGTLLGSTTFTVKSASSSLAPDQVSQTANILDAMRATLEQLYQAASR